ncbi:ABC transporter permease [Candidatus Micrarchaeota archaeon]|nr:ABC transporter permease [Candidatus Micrarchaeota archaeon]
MEFTDILDYSIKNLKTTKLRTYLTVIGIIIGVVTMLTISSISEGVQADINKQLSSFGPDKMFIIPTAVTGASAFSSPNQAATSGKLFLRDADILENIAGVKSLARTAYGRTTFGFKSKSITATVYGIEPVYFDQWDNYLELSTGRLYTESDRKVAVLGYRAANNLFGQNKVNVGSIVRIGKNDYRVVGILKEIGSSFSGADDSSIYIPFDDGKEEFSSQLAKNEINFISISVLDGYPAKDVQQAIEDRLISLHKVTSDTKDFSVITSDFVNQTIGGLISGLAIFLLFITMIATLVGGIGIMNTMFMAVLERTNEIGVLKAIGASQKDIRMIFVVESTALGIIGGIIGLILGSLITVFIGSLGVPYLISIQTVFLSFLFALLVGLFAGLLPAGRAAKLDPVEALREE